MAARPPWTFPLFPLRDLDRRILQFCSPATAPTPAPANAQALLERALALDVFPLVFHRLRAGSPGGREFVTPEWEERFRANAARNLYLHSEQRRLLARLADAGVFAAPLKGTTLAQRVYGDLALRTQADIDLYVAARHLPTALEALAAAGCQLVAPAGVEPEWLGATGDPFANECVLLSQNGRLPVWVEVHWRLLPLPDEQLSAAFRATGAPGDELDRSLPGELNLLYLCLRAAAARWGSLKLLVDLAHWLVREAPEWTPLLRSARRLGLRRILFITLAALETYFGTPVPRSVQKWLEAARPRRLAAATVANPFAAPVPLTSAAVHRLRLGLHERVQDRLGYAARLLRPTARDLAALRLPRSLGFVYWGVRWLRVSGLWKDLKHEPAGARS